MEASMVQFYQMVLEYMNESYKFLIGSFVSDDGTEGRKKVRKS